jgi:hypothetical protein
VQFYTMSTSKRMSGLILTAGIAIILIFGNSFPNALSLSSLEIRANRKLAAGAGFHDAEALDATNIGDLGPVPLAHVQLGVV